MGHFCDLCGERNFELLLWLYPDLTLCVACNDDEMRICRCCGIKCHMMDLLPVPGEDGEFCSVCMDIFDEHRRRFV